MARVLRDQLLIDSKTALLDPNSDAWIKVAEGCALTAGLIGGIGGAKCRTAAAHAVHNGLTQLDFKKKSLHGELVGYGILVQLRIEELLSKSQLALQTKKQLIELLIDLDLPIDIQSLGLKSYKKKELEKACIFACRRNSEIHNLPFKVNEKTLMEALLDANKFDLISSDRKNLIGKK
jgi:glycerol dehydrogenase